MFTIVLSICTWAFLAWLSKRSYSTALLVVVGVIPTYIIRVSFLGFPTNLFETSVIVVVAIGLLYGNIGPRLLSVAIGLPNKMKIAIIGFIIASALSTFLSDEPVVSLGILKSWIIIPTLLGWMVLEVSSREPGYRRRVVDALLLSGSAVSVISLFQIGSVPRLFSIYDVPNSLALWLSPLVIISFWLALDQKRYLVHALLMSIGLLGTLSVAGIGSTGLTLIAGVLVFRPPRARPIIVVIIFTVSVTMLTLSLSGRIDYFTSAFRDPDTHTSLNVRAQLWSIGLDLITENPVFGVGLGQFEPAYQQKLHQYFSLDSNRKLIPEFVFRDPHNWAISFWLNAGIFGLASFVVIIISTIINTIESRSVLSESLALALIAILIFGSVDTIYWKNDLATMFWIFAGLVNSLILRKRRAG